MMCAPSAHADVNEVRVGLMAHNICITNCKNADKENGPDLELEADWDSPHVLHWLGSPRPYALASINLAGETSHVAVGLDWRFRLTEHWSLEPGIGYAIHNGKVRNPYPDGDPRATQFSDEHILFGSRDLFRPTLGLTYAVNDHWDAQFFYAHLSHGQILGKGRNQGVDDAGIRIGYRFR